MTEPWNTADIPNAEDREFWPAPPRRPGRRAARGVECPYCGFDDVRLPAPADKARLVCPNCQERFRPSWAYPPYRPLDRIDYAQQGQREKVRIIAGASAPQGEGAPASDAELYAILVESGLQPWYLRTRVIVTLLIVLAPAGIALLWAQRPRRSGWGGTPGRALLSLVCGAAWLAVVVGGYPRYAPWLRQVEASSERLVRRLASQASEGQPAVEAVPVRRAQFEALRVGDPLERVKATLGGSGIELSRHRFEEVPGVLPALETVVYTWRNADGSSLEAVFQNDLLTTKSQAGLP